VGSSVAPQRVPAVATLFGFELRSFTDVAASLDVDRKTVWSWRREPGFAAALKIELAQRGKRCRIA
jgi:hypothetical protein